LQAGLRFLRAVAGRARKDEILEVAQDGGAVTAILMAGLEAGMIDTAIVMYMDEEWRSIPGLARSGEELLRAAGSKYVYASLIPKLRETALSGEASAIALVGTPCQINAAAGVKRAVKEVGEKLRLTICLFCTHSWEWRAMEEMTRELGISLRDIVKMDIKRRFLFHHKSGEVYEYPLDKALEKARKACSTCPYFISPNADLAIGAIGSPKGWNSILVISGEGERFLQNAVDRGLLEVKDLSEKGIAVIRRFYDSKREEAERARSR
jgi:coenzyme F420 hydrogenase subunit beta